MPRRCCCPCLTVVDVVATSVWQQAVLKITPFRTESSWLRPNRAHWLADARQIQNLCEDICQMKQEHARQLGHLGHSDELHHIKQAKGRLLHQLQDAEDNVQQLNKEKDELLQQMTTVEGHASKLRCQVSELEHYCKVRVSLL